MRYASFEDVVAGHEDEFPVLAAAVANIGKPMVNPSMEWLLPDGTVEKNHAEIVRSPDVDGLLRKCEAILDRGDPPQGDARRCSGVRHFLGRPYEPGDDVSLRPLRSPFYRRDPDEWVCEFSLQVTPKG
jgi:hypothetical protein